MADLIELAFGDGGLDNGKARLVRALIELSTERPFHTITVLDICRKARFSRQTFYRYFESKYAVAQWYWHQIASKYLLRVGRDFDWHESLQKNFQVADPSLRFFLDVAPDGGYESLQSFGYRDRVMSLRNTVVDHLGLNLTDEINFQIVFFADEEARTMARIGTVPNQPDGERIADLLESCVPRKLYDLLNAPS